MALATQPLSSRQRRSPAILFLIFLLMGTSISVVFLWPVSHVISARHWRETPCRILSSEVREHPGDDGSTYSVDIVYSYSVNGRPFTSARYQFMGGSSSGYEGKEAIVRRLPAGTWTVCYVNPADPADAVLERGFTKVMLFGLIPLLFVIIGAVGLFFSRRQTSAAAAKAWAPKAFPNVGDFRTLPASPMELKPRLTPAGKLLSASAVMLFWNGILSVFVYHVAEGWRTGHGQWLISIFLVPFALVGLGVAGLVIWLFLALFNPRVHLRLAPGVLKPGIPYSLEWNIPGGAARLSDLRILLECREEADYQSGDSNSTATHVCYRAVVANAGSREEIAAGTAKGSLPSRLMHSLDTGRNRIKWVVRVEGRVPRWPGIKDEYPVVMLPESWKEPA